MAGESDIRPGNALKLRDIPVGTFVHNGVAAGQRRVIPFGRGSGSIMARGQVRIA